MQAGIIFGFTAQVEGMVDRIRKELGEQPRVIATGGFAGLIAAQTPIVELVDQRLMLEGLRLIYDMTVWAAPVWPTRTSAARSSRPDATDPRPGRHFHRRGHPVRDFHKPSQTLVWH